MMGIDAASTSIMLAMRITDGALAWFRRGGLRRDGLASPAGMCLSYSPDGCRPLRCKLRSLELHLSLDVKRLTWLTSKFLQL